MASGLRYIESIWDSYDFTDVGFDIDIYGFRYGFRYGKGQSLGEENIIRFA